MTKTKVSLSIMSLLVAFSFATVASAQVGGTVTRSLPATQETAPAPVDAVLYTGDASALPPKAEVLSAPVPTNADISVTSAPLSTTSAPDVSVTSAPITTTSAPGTAVPINQPVNATDSKVEKQPRITTIPEGAVEKQPRDASKENKPVKAEEKDEKSNAPLYIGLGALVVALLGLVLVKFKK